MPLSAVSLVHDTVYRRSRRRAIGLLHDLDDRLYKARTVGRRIVIEAASPMNAAILKPVYSRLASDPRLELCFTTPTIVWQPEQIFGPIEPAQLVSTSAAAWLKADAYLNADFWDMTWMHRRTRRVHFFHGVAGKYGLDAPTTIAPIVATFDGLMFPNADRRARYTEAGLVPEGNDLRAALVGYPKVDCLVDGSLDRPAILRELAFDPSTPTIIYAPTWSPYSSLNGMGEAIIDALAAEGLQVIIKLHDRSYDPGERGSGGIDWAARLLRFESHPRVRIAREADGSPFLVAADAMVSDHSSIAFEYMLLDRPIVVIDRPELIVKAGISTDKVRRLRSAAEVAQNPREMAAAVVRGLRDPDCRSAERRRTARELFHEPGTATSRALQLIYQLIDLPAPADRAFIEHGCALAAAG
jgi:hypothetical protein